MWKYLVGLFVFTIVLNIPLLVYIDAISNAITRFFSMEAKDNATGYIIYAIMMIAQLPLVMQVTKSTLYEILYIVTCILVAIMNPYGFLTTPYPPWYLFVLTVLLFPCLKLAYPIVQVVLLVILTVAAENQIITFLYKSSYVFLAYLLFYLIGYGIYFITFQPDRFRKVFDVVAWIKEKGGVLWTFLVSTLGMIVKLPFFYVLTILSLIGFALFHLYIRQISKQTYGGTLLVHRPIPLNAVSSYKIPVNYHYTTSFWFYIHPTPPSYSPSATEYSTVLLIGDNVLVAYNAEKNKIEVRLKDDSKVNYTIPLQKWNHMAMIYSNGIMDVFVNGELIQTDTWVPHTLTNDLIVGATNGIHGKICNLIYYDKVMTHAFVKSLYKEFKHKNPPIL